MHICTSPRAATAAARDGGKGERGKGEEKGRSKSGIQRCVHIVCPVEARGRPGLAQGLAAADKVRSHVV